MKVRILCASLMVLLCLFPFLAYPLTDPSFSPKKALSLLVKNEGQPPFKQESNEGFSQAIRQYENEKLAKLKRNIGRRLLTVKTAKPAEFYESPDDLERRLRIDREKEGFVIVGVVQNQSGTMNFYQTRLDTGQTGYLSADGHYLEIKIKEGSLISVPRGRRGKRESLNRSKASISEAIELVRSHLTLVDPVTGEKRSVEKRMRDEKSRSFPNLKWRYDAKAIGNNKYRVMQHAGEGAGPPLIRTWIVDLSKTEVKPENLSAKEMDR